MRILIIRSWGQTAFEMGVFCKKALQEIGHTVKFFTYNAERISSRIPFFRNSEQIFTEKRLIKQITDFRPELLLVIKGDRIRPKTIHKVKNNFGVIVANYWIDDPFSIDVSRQISSCYDYFFTNDPDCIPIHEESGCSKVEFISFGCAPYLHRKANLSKKEYERYHSDICFAGTVTEKRLEILEELSDFDLKVWSPRVVHSLMGKCQIKINRLPVSSSLYHKFTDRAVWGEELVKVYNASKIVINIHSPQPVPIMRDFEVTGCGAFLLTDCVRALQSMLKTKEEIVCYENVKELRKQAQFYLEHPTERKKIARQGQIRTYKDHTYAKRMWELISFIEKDRL